MPLLREGVEGGTVGSPSENPECMDTESSASDMYVTISQQSLGGIDSKEDTKYQNTIIKNVLVNTKIP